MFFLILFGGFDQVNSFSACSTRYHHWAQHLERLVLTASLAVDGDFSLPYNRQGRPESQASKAFVSFLQSIQATSPKQNPSVPRGHRGLFFELSISAYFISYLRSPLSRPTGNHAMNRVPTLTPVSSTFSKAAMSAYVMYRRANIDLVWREEILQGMRYLKRTYTSRRLLKWEGCLLYELLI